MYSLPLWEDPECNTGRGEKERSEYRTRERHDIIGSPKQQVLGRALKVVPRALVACGTLHLCTTYQSICENMNEKCRCGGSYFAYEAIYGTLCEYHWYLNEPYPMPHEVKQAHLLRMSQNYTTKTIPNSSLTNTEQRKKMTSAVQCLTTDNTGAHTEQNGTLT